MLSWPKRINVTQTLALFNQQGYHFVKITLINFCGVRAVNFFNSSLRSFTMNHFVRTYGTRLAGVRFVVLISLASLTFLTACSKEPAVTPESVEDVVDAPVEKQQLTVYSSRAEHLIKPLFERYTEETGVHVRYITDKEGPLIARLKAEEERTPADLLLTVDAGNLWYASSQDVLQSVQSDVLEANVPVHLRASDNSWFGLSIRARTLVYSTERVLPSELSSYEALADETWKGRLCLRTSKKVYNQSMVAAMIASEGEEQTEAVVSGWVSNLAIEPFSNDTKAMEAVAAGVCDVTIVNSYYFGRLMEKQPEVPLAIFWPNQDDRGVHVNVSGIGITRYAKNPELALHLIEWLSSTAAQQEFAGRNKEYPVNPVVKPVAEVAAWGEFKPDLIDVEQAGQLQATAIKLMDRAGYK